MVCNSMYYYSSYIFTMWQVDFTVYFVLTGPGSPTVPQFYGNPGGRLLRYSYSGNSIGSPGTYQVFNSYLLTTRYIYD